MYSVNWLTECGREGTDMAGFRSYEEAAAYRAECQVWAAALGYRLWYVVDWDINYVPIQGNN